MVRLDYLAVSFHSTAIPKQFSFCGCRRLHVRQEQYVNSFIVKNNDII